MTKIIFYNNHNCPYAQRVHITLKELGLEFEEVIIDLSKPREPWYLEINPRGLVPAIDYDGHLIYESAVIIQFLADLKPSHLLPGSGSFENALTRARVNFFIETLDEKVKVPFFASLTAAEETERATKANQFIDAIEKDIVPLLKDAAPFFGGNKEFTLAEASAAPFIVRLQAYWDPEAGLLPTFVKGRLNSLTAFKAWADAVSARKSVSESYDVKTNIQKTQERLAKLRK